MSKEKFVTLCIDKLEEQTAKGVLKAMAREMPVAEDCLYQMFKDKEIGLEQKIRVEGVKDLTLA
jgi:hypothetical protein